jgi:hypothetical protein
MSKNGFFVIVFALTVICPGGWLAAKATHGIEHDPHGSIPIGGGLSLPVVF